MMIRHGGGLRYSLRQYIFLHLVVVAAAAENEEGLEWLNRRFSRASADKRPVVEIAGGGDQQAQNPGAEIDRRIVWLLNQGSWLLSSERQQ